MMDDYGTCSRTACTPTLHWQSTAALLEIREHQPWTECKEGLLTELCERPERAGTNLDLESKFKSQGRGHCLVVSGHFPLRFPFWGIAPGHALQFISYTELKLSWIQLTWGLHTAGKCPRECPRDVNIRGECRMNVSGKCPRPLDSQGPLEA